MKMVRTRLFFASAVLVGAFSTGLAVDRAVADQPYMQRALDQLQAAHGTLIAGAADKGGHRVAALRDVDAAINEVRAGIGFARDH